MTQRAYFWRRHYSSRTIGVERVLSVSAGGVVEIYPIVFLLFALDDCLIEYDFGCEHCCRLDKLGCSNEWSVHTRQSWLICTGSSFNFVYAPVRGGSNVIDIRYSLKNLTLV